MFAKPVIEIMRGDALAPRTNASIVLKTNSEPSSDPSLEDITGCFTLR